ncbi:MAG: DUF6714 family protein [Cyanobacteria bacterium J06634_5]
MEKSSYQQRKLALIREIVDAFEGVARGNGVTLHEALVIDDYGGPDARAKARTKDTEPCWQAVPEEDIRCKQAVLSFLYDEGFHYYIPAYLVWYVQNIDSEGPEYESNTFDSVIFHLTGLGDERLSGRFKRFTTEQCRAIAHFLLFEAERQEVPEIEWMRESLAKGGLSPEEIEPILRSHDFCDTDIRKALDQYWQQFL